MTSEEETRRNLDPHKAARAAMYLWSEECMAKGLGSMGFWDQLPQNRKDFARAMVKEIEAARPERP